MTDGLRSLRAVSLPQSATTELHRYLSIAGSGRCPRSLPHYSAGATSRKIQAEAQKKNRLRAVGRKRCNIYKNQLSGLFCSLNLLCLASGSSGAGTIIGIKVYGEDPSHTLTHSHSHSSLSRRLGRRVFFGVFPPSTSSASLTFSNRESDSRYSQNAVVLVSQHANGWTRGIIHASPGRKGNKTKQKRKIRSGWEEVAGGGAGPDVML